MFIGLIYEELLTLKALNEEGDGQSNPILLRVSASNLSNIYHPFTSDIDGLKEEDTWPSSREKRMSYSISILLSVYHLEGSSGGSTGGGGGTGSSSTSTTFLIG